MGKILDLSEKAIDGLSLDDIIYLHVTPRAHQRTSEYFMRSSLQELLEYMGSSSFRGKPAQHGASMCAFTILDQIGSSYADKKRAAPLAKISIKKALHYFCGIDGDSAEAQHLYAFRNAQVQGTGYANRDITGNWYNFRDDQEFASVIQPPKHAWDGQASTLSVDTTTLINRKKLIDLATTAIQEVAKLYGSRPADLGILLSKREILHRYLFWVEKPVLQICR